MDSSADDDYSLRELIKSGGYGSVSGGIRLKDNYPVAMKCIRSSRDMVFLKEGLPMEVFCLQQLADVDGVTELLDWFYDLKTERYVLIFERYTNLHDLYHYTRHYNTLPEETCKGICRKLVTILCKMKKMGFIHGDIKTENIMFDQQTSEVKLVDFGACMITNSKNERDDEFNSSLGTQSYCPPEWHRVSLYSGTRATVWAIGVCLCDMTLGYIPFNTIRETKRNDHRFLRKAGLSDQLTDLIRLCLKTKPSDRIKLEMISRHPWLALTD